MTDPVEALFELKHRLTTADWQIICAYAEGTTYPVGKITKKDTTHD